jgi:hypothetical protein
MLTLADEQEHLRSANAHLRNAVYLIAVQHGRVVSQTTAGLNSDASEGLLSLMNATLRNFLRHRIAIVEAIELMRQSPLQ